MPSSAELAQALDESNKQLSTLNEIQTNKKNYNLKADELNEVVKPNNEFNEPTTPYNAQYPYNNAWASESGHSIELDDTPNAERVAITHRSGTFTEVHPDGSKVDKIVNDNVQIVVKDNHIYITGNENKSIQGSLKLYIKGNVKAQVDGEVEIDIATGSLVLHTEGMVTAMAKSFNLIGDINHIGDFKTTGNILNQGNIVSAKNIQAQQNFVGLSDLQVAGQGTYGGDVVAGGISLDGHVHTSSTVGTNTSTPVKS